MDSFPLERPYITITNVIWSFDYDTQQVKVLLIRRADEPFKNFWALPEILLREDESAHEASLRLIKEKIGLSLSDVHAEQLATFTAPDRNPDFRALSLSYMIFLPKYVNLVPGSGAIEAEWFTLEKIKNNYFGLKKGDLFFKTLAENEYVTELDSQKRLAFDHNWILTVACHRIVNKLNYQPTILLTLGSSFTLKTARHVYGIFGQDETDNSNFLQNNKKIFELVGEVDKKGPGRPAKKFRLLISF